MTHTSHALPAAPALCAELVTLVRHCYAQGWAPATSTNFSFRDPDNPQWYALTQSGKDKGLLTTDDLVWLDAQATVLSPLGARPSAETALHLERYEDPAVMAVGHTHSVANTVLSLRFEAAGELRLAGLELLKALWGFSTHEAELVLPVFPNTQDIDALAADVRAWAQAHQAAGNGPFVGYLIAGHGMYTWGRSLAEVKRHIEALEFLLACRLHMA